MGVALRLLLHLLSLTRSFATALDGMLWHRAWKNPHCCISGIASTSPLWLQLWARRSLLLSILVLGRRISLCSLFLTLRFLRSRFSMAARRSRSPSAARSHSRWTRRGDDGRPPVGWLTSRLRQSFQWCERSPTITPRPQQGHVNAVRLQPSAWAGAVIGSLNRRCVPPLSSLRDLEDSLLLLCGRRDELPFPARALAASHQLSCECTGSWIRGQPCEAGCNLGDGRAMCGRKFDIVRECYLCHRSICASCMPREEVALRRQAICRFCAFTSSRLSGCPVNPSPSTLAADMAFHALGILILHPEIFFEVLLDTGSDRWAYPLLTVTFKEDTEAEGLSADLISWCAGMALRCPEVAQAGDAVTVLAWKNILGVGVGRATDRTLRLASAALAIALHPEFSPCFDVSDEGGPVFLRCVQMLRVIAPAAIPFRN